MKTIKFECDCGCGAVTLHKNVKRHWLVLRQFKKQPGSGRPALKRKFYFNDFKCLARWAERAEVNAEKLEESFRTAPTPRGELSFSDFEGMSI